MRKIMLILALMAFIGMSFDVYADTDADYDKALRYYNSGKYQESIKLFKEYTQNTPAPAAYYRIGYALYKQGKFEEANEYFREVYLLSPTFSPEKIGQYEKYQKRRQKAEAKPAAVPEAKTPQPVKEAPVAAAQPQMAQPSAGAPAAEQPAQAPQAKVPTPPEAVKAPAVPEAGTTPTPPVMLPPTPMIVPKEIPGGITGIVSGLIAGFAMFILIIGMALYLFFSFCLFKIAKKLDVPAAWTAWIPIVQTWTQVACAGKPWWWVLLLLVPIVGFFLYIYLWMCISENLGKNKWLGLLILVPPVFLGLVAWLAFSGGEKASESSEELPGM